MTNTFFKYPIKRLEKGGDGGGSDDYSDGDDIIMVVIRMLMIFIMPVMVVNRSLLRTDKFHFGSVFFLLGALCSLGRPQANDSPASCPSFLNAEISGRCGHTGCFLQKFVNTLVHQCSAHRVSTDYSLEKVLVPWPEWLFNYNYSNMWMICWTIVSYRLGESVSIKLIRKLHVCLC